ncbi:MAG: serine/threonine transporter SstT [Lachnospiraceae bacterium]|nr:serine/threonine transporter SstT [Lachnospiraceae bacterium]
MGGHGITKIALWLFLIACYGKTKIWCAYRCIWYNYLVLDHEEGISVKIIEKYNNTSLIIRIFIGLVIGAALGIIIPGNSVIPILGSLFVGALKAVAPILVFVLVISSLAQGTTGFDSRFGFVIFLYLFSTLMAGLVAVAASFMFPLTVTLTGEADVSSAPSGVGEVLENLVLSMVSNPVDALANANYVSILFWAVLLGIVFKKLAKDATKQVISDLADAVSKLVGWIINLAPFGIMGLIYDTISESGLSIFVDYGKLLLLLVGTMLVVALVLNPIHVFLAIRATPYPLVFRCLRESAVMAFFMRSSAANIPVNMELCKKLGLDEDIYSVSIPLGATINMDGAAVVITIMTMTAANTIGLEVDIPSAIILSLLSTLAACGTSGVAGGSLLLIPMACSLFGIPQDVAMQMVGVGYIINVIQDSFETALNSSGDALFTATAEYHHWKKNGKSLPTFLGGETKVDI